MPDIIVKGVDGYNNAKYFSPGVDDGLLGALVAGVSADRSTRNWAEGEVEFIPVGAPTVNAYSAVYGGATGYLNTGITETADMTLYAIFKPYSAASQRGSVIGNRPGVAYVGVNLFISLGGQIGAMAGVYDGATGAAVNKEVYLSGYSTDLESAPFHMFRAEVDSAAKVVRIADITAGTSNATTSWGANVRDLRSAAANPMWIGNNPWGYNIPNEIMAGLIYNRVLSLKEHETVEGRLRALAARCGVTV